MNRLAEIVRETGRIPLSWAGSTQKMHYLNFGDALSPVMVALCTGVHVERIPFRSTSARLGAVGTVGHAFEMGEVWFWGTGCSGHKNPSGPTEERIPYVPPADSIFHVRATRGPVSGRLLTGGSRAGSGVYGDPVWLMPRFYKPLVEKRWEVGVILHLSELTDRSFTPNPHPHFRRYDTPGEFGETVHLINTVTPIDVGSLRLKLDEILACKRILSTSLHGMVIAESYGIPCLYFAPFGASKPGLATRSLVLDEGLDLRIVDLYQGLGRSRLPVYVQPRTAPTDWNNVISAVDSAWSPIDLRSADDLLNALPIDPAPVESPSTGTVFDMPLLQGLQLQHDVAQLRREERQRNKVAASRKTPAGSTGSAEPLPASRNEPGLLQPLPKSARPVDAAAPMQLEAALDPEKLLAALNRDRFVVPLAWAATTPKAPLANFGDALSPLIVSTITGLPIRRRNFDQNAPRLVAVGTIGHAQHNGTAHFWGTGFDATRHPLDPTVKAYARPPSTQLIVHALRGPRSAELLRRQGVAAPDIFGDPVWFLPKMIDRPKPVHELGIVVHLTELAERELGATTREELRRYAIPDELAGSIRIINTLNVASVDGLLGKAREILSCKRILSTSLHGLVVAEAFGVPCAWFGTYPGGPKLLDLEEGRVDHRVRDFYLGAGRLRLPIFCQDRTEESRWEEIIGWIDSSWEPLSYDGSALFEAFPLPKAVRFEDEKWPLPMKILDSIPF